MPECPFCRIVAGSDGAAVVWSDEQTVVFLDHRPLFAGHCLVVPRRHVSHFEDLLPGEVSAVFRTAQKAARAVEIALGAEGAFVALNNKVSQSVPHLHVHVVPRRKGDGLRGFFWPRTAYKTGDDLRQTGEKLRAAFELVAQASLPVDAQAKTPAPP
jgi:histidine triad (HIT) family protein